MQNNELSPELDLLDKLSDQILDAEKEFAVKIPESTFVATMLPIIKMGANATDFSPWLAITKTWSRDAEVYGSDGEFLFRVPGLVSRVGQPKPHKAQNSVYELTENAKRKMDVMPQAANQMLERGLEGRVQPTGDLEENRKAWDYIYERYGISVKQDNVTSSDAAIKPKPTVKVEGYEDL